MKRISVLAMLALVLVFGLAFVGCDSGSNERPEMTEIYVVKSADWEAGNYYNYVTTIAATEYYMLRWVFKSPYEDVERFGITIKRGATVISSNERAWNSIIPKTGAFSTFSGDYMLPAGTYTIEVYIVDVKGNKSNTKTVTLTVTQ